MYAPGTQRMGPSTMMAGAAPTGAMSPYGTDGDGYDGEGRGRRRALWWILGAVAALVVVVLAYLLLSGGGGKTDAVPSVVGMTQSQAEKAVTKAGLTPKVVKIASSSVKPGIVISTEPAVRCQGGPEQRGHAAGVGWAEEDQRAQRGGRVAGHRAAEPEPIPGDHQDG